MDRLKQTDKQLYEEYISKFPYKTGEITNIDFEALLIEQMKCRMTRADVLFLYGKYGVTDRTFTRKIAKMEKTNPYIYELYRQYAKLNKNGANKSINSIELFEKIDRLESREVVLGERTDKREKELNKLEKEFLELKKRGLTNNEACNELGISFSVLYKQMLDLSRIREERKIIQERIH